MPSTDPNMPASNQQIWPASGAFPVNQFVPVLPGVQVKLQPLDQPGFFARLFGANPTYQLVVSAAITAAPATINPSPQ
jgi:hypothetical protein